MQQQRTEKKICILYNNNAPFKLFTDQTEGLNFLSMLAESRYLFAHTLIKKKSNAEIFDCNLYLYVMHFNAYGMFVKQDRFDYDTASKTCKITPVCAKLESVNESVNERVNESVNERVNESVKESAEISIEKTNQTEEELDNEIKNLCKTGDNACRTLLHITQKHTKTQISIYTANKTTYCKIKGKLATKILKRSNIPSLFAAKYAVFEYMEDRGYVSLTSNDNADTELEIFDQLHKIIESNDYLENNTLFKQDPLLDISPSFSEMCNDFLVYLEQHENIPQSEHAIHYSLNKEKFDKIFDKEDNTFDTNAEAD